MAYGTVKVDTIIFDQGGADQNVTVSGIYRAITSGVTVTGTISGAVLIGTTTVSGATVTGTAVQGTTVQGVSGTFTSLTGTTTTGTTANFVSGVFTTRISGTTVTGDTGQFTSGTFVSLTGTTITGTTINAVTVSSTTGTFGSITGTTITGTTINGATVNSTTGNFTSLTGVTVTGTTAQFASGVFITQVSGLTVTGTQSSFTSGNFVTLSGATATFTSGVIASGTAAAPSLSIISDPNTGIYSSGADQVAVATNGTGRLFIDSAGLVGVNQASPGSALDVNGEIRIYPASGDANLRFGSGGVEKGRIAVNSSSNCIIETAGTERLRITSAGLVGIGTSAPGAKIHSVETSAAEGLRVDGASSGFSFIVEGGTTRVTRSRQATIGNSYVGNTPPIDGLIVEGSVGIGTTSPLTKLEVRSGVITAGSVSSTNGAEILRGYYGSSGALVVIGSEYSSGGPVIGCAVKPSTSASDAFLSSTSEVLTRGAYTIAGNIHKWYIGGSQTVAENSSVTMSEVMRIDSSGNVGIGTTSPAQALSVVGNIIADGPAASQYVASSKAGVTTTYLMTDANGGNIQTDGAWPIRFTTNSSERARIDSSGRLLVGTSSSLLSYANLQVTGGSDNAGHVCLANTSAAPVSGANIGSIRFTNSAGGIGAIFGCEADGSWTAGSNYRSRLVFSVTADGAASPTEALRIKSTRIVNIANTPVHADNAAAKTAGLVDGDVYRKSDGTMMIVFT